MYSSNNNVLCYEILASASLVSRKEVIWYFAFPVKDMLHVYSQFHLAPPLFILTILQFSESGMRVRLWTFFNKRQRS